MMKCDLKQLLAAIGSNYLPQVRKTPAISSLNLLRPYRILEPPIAESANWKLSLAGNSKLNSNVQTEMLKVAHHGRLTSLHCRVGVVRALAHLPSENIPSVTVFSQCVSQCKHFAALCVLPCTVQSNRELNPGCFFGTDFAGSE